MAVNLQEEYNKTDIQGVIDQLEHDLVGLAPVKARIKEIAALLLVQRLRKNLGLGMNSAPIGLHMSFTGSPGTGKTAAFILPILNKLTNKDQNKSKVNTIIIAPTRELAKQIDMQIEGFSYFTSTSSYPIYGGGTCIEFENQKQALKKGVDIIICTPGRLIAHLDFNYFDTSEVKHLVLDEITLIHAFNFFILFS